MNNKIAEIREFSLNLSKYFRYALRNTSEFVTIQSEIDFIKVYSKVQKIRYPNAFYIMFDVDEELMEEMIPPLIIQNFVENSTKYALVPGEEIEILVIIKKMIPLCGFQYVTAEGVLMKNCWNRYLRDRLSVTAAEGMWEYGIV